MKNTSTNNTQKHTVHTNLCKLKWENDKDTKSLHNIFEAHKQNPNPAMSEIIKLLDAYTYALEYYNQNCFDGKDCSMCSAYNGINKHCKYNIGHNMKRHILPYIQYSDGRFFYLENCETSEEIATLTINDLYENIESHYESVKTADNVDIAFGIEYTDMIHLEHFNLFQINHFNYETIHYKRIAELIDCVERDIYHIKGKDMSDFTDYIKNKYPEIYSHIA